jgi:hypothetical protein
MRCSVAPGELHRKSFTIEIRNLTQQRVQKLIDINKEQYGNFNLFLLKKLGSF